MGYPCFAYSPTKLKLYRLNYSEINSSKSFNTIKFGSSSGRVLGKMGTASGKWLINNPHLYPELPLGRLVGEGVVDLAQLVLKPPTREDCNLEETILKLF